MAKKEKEQKDKPLEKLTTKDLRELSLKVGGITGVHGMNKEELIGAIRAARGETTSETKKAAKSVPVRELKAKVAELQAKRIELAHAGDKKRANIIRKKMSRLKRATRHSS